MAKKRTEIPNDLADRLLAANRHTCCICHERHDVVIHHIDENPSNNDPENLCVLCYGCHSLVHSNQGLGRKYSPGELKIYKGEWEERCKVEDTKKRFVANVFVFAKDVPQFRDLELIGRIVTDISSGTTMPQVNASLDSSANIVAESTGDQSMADDFKLYLLDKKRD